MTWFNNLPPFVRNIITGIVTTAVTLLLTYLASTGLYRPPVVNVAAPNVMVQFPDGATVQLPAKDVTERKAMAAHPFVTKLKAKLITAAVEKGATEEQAFEAIKVLESDRPLIDWFLKGGFLELLKMVMEIINALK